MQVFSFLIKWTGKICILRCSYYWVSLSHKCRWSKTKVAINKVVSNVSEISTYVSTCIELLRARVLQSFTWRPLMIVIECRVEEGKYNTLVAYQTMNFQNSFSRMKIFSKAFNSQLAYDQCLVLASFTKYFETNKRIQEM